MRRSLVPGPFAGEQRLAGRGCARAPRRRGARRPAVEDGRPRPGRGRRALDDAADARVRVRRRSGRARVRRPSGRADRWFRRARHHPRRRRVLAVRKPRRQASRLSGAGGGCGGRRRRRGRRRRGTESAARARPRRISAAAAGVLSSAGFGAAGPGRPFPLAPRNPPRQPAPPTVARARARARPRPPPGPRARRGAP